MTASNHIATDVELLQQAVEFAKTGRKDEARMRLAEACLINPFNEKAWLWRASLAPSKSDAIAWLQRVLALNPNNETARSWIQRLQPASVPEPEPPAMLDPAPAKAEPAGQSLSTQSVAAQSVSTQSVAAQSVSAQSVSTQSVSTWICPFCSYESQKDQTRCPDCGGMSVLDLKAIEGNKGANERQLRHAAEHYQKMLERGESVYGYYLALVQLNLHRSFEAHVALKQYVEDNPKDAEAAAVCKELGLRKLVLAVDDSPTVRSIVADALDRAHYRCVSACSGVDAVGFLTDNPPPDMILLDVSMPVMDGYQLCKTIKAMPDVKHVPVVMLSGNDGFIDKVKGRMAGAADYLTKPFNPAALLAVIQKLTAPQPHKK